MTDDQQGKESLNVKVQIYQKWTHKENTCTEKRERERITSNQIDTNCKLLLVCLDPLMKLSIRLGPQQGFDIIGRLIIVIKSLQFTLNECKVKNVKSKNKNEPKELVVR